MVPEEKRENWQDENVIKIEINNMGKMMLNMGLLSYGGGNINTKKKIQNLKFYRMSTVSHISELLVKLHSIIASIIGVIGLAIAIYTVWGGG